ncbi:MAG: homoserine dehydrogenase [Candidatus Omnitrophota bacterium]|nr:homoserine dehydrogenase [Candidatus Omnitrophota bacterium]MDZ4241875.1 homoserine dehydrogenase [Candidatus Omnitrophota bacterium]
MNKINLGLIGYGNVGSGVVKFLQTRANYFRNKFHTEFVLKTICDRSTRDKNFSGLGDVQATTDINQVLNDPSIDVVIELIGGIHPAKEIVLGALKNGKHVVTANKELLAHHAQELFREVHKRDKNIYFESSVMAGVPVISMLTHGIAGNVVSRLYGIINGTCNFILTEMTKNDCTFSQALEKAQKKGFAEANPKLDISGMDSAHKLAILTSLTLGKFLKIEDIYTEGITHISHVDIEHAESMNLTIKLLGIAKRVENAIEARVHPTLISKDHPLASINGIYNALFLSTEPLGDILISGEGAGQMAAASGVISDLLNLASRTGSEASNMLGNLYTEAPDRKVTKIDEIKTRFYLRFIATDKPGVLSTITGILGKHGISINSVTQKAHIRRSTVPVIMLTDYAPEKNLRIALEKIFRLSIVKSMPVAIRMENLS